jgi:hypothetical protein
MKGPDVLLGQILLSNATNLCIMRASRDRRSQVRWRIRPEKLARMIEQAGAGMMMMIGVQLN